MLPHGFNTPGARTIRYYEAQSHGHYFAVYASRRRLPERPARLATGWRLPLAGWDFRPLGSIVRFLDCQFISILLTQA